VSRRRREMYCGHTRLCVCLSVCVSVCPRPHAHYCTDQDVTWESGRRCPLVVQYWADLKSVHGFRCYNTAGTRNVSECLYSLYAWLNFFNDFNDFISWPKSGFLTIFIWKMDVQNNYDHNVSSSICFRRSSWRPTNSIQGLYEGTQNTGLQPGTALADKPARRAASWRTRCKQIRWTLSVINS